MNRTLLRNLLLSSEELRALAELLAQKRGIQDYENMSNDELSHALNPIQPGLFGAPQAWGGRISSPLSNPGLDYDIKTKLCTNIPHISTINLECLEF